MSILDRFKRNALKMVAFATFMTAGLSAAAQKDSTVKRDDKGRVIEKTYHYEAKKEKEKKTVNPKIITPGTNTKRVVSDTTISKKGGVDGKKRAEKVRDEAYRKLTPEQRKERDRQYLLIDKKKRAALEARLAAKLTIPPIIDTVITTKIVGDSIPPVVAQDSSYERESFYEKRDSIIKYEYVPVPVKDSVKADTVRKTPWLLSVGPVWDGPIGKQTNATAPATGVYTTFQDQYPNSMQGYFLEVRTPQFGKKGTFGSNFSATLRVEKYPNVEVKTLVEKEVPDGSLFDARYNAATVRDNARLSLNAGGMYGEGRFKVSPTLQVGLIGKRAIDVRIDSVGQGPGRDLPYQFTSSQRESLKASLNGYAGASVNAYFFLGKDKITKDTKNTDKGEHYKKQAKGFFVQAGFGIYGSTEKTALPNSQTGLSPNATKVRTNAVIGIGFAF